MMREDPSAESADDEVEVIPELRGYPSVLRSDEVAEVLRLETTRVAYLMRKGSLPGFKVGGEWRCLRSALQAFILAGGSAGSHEGASGH